MSGLPWSEREKFEVIDLAAKGYTASEIAENIGRTRNAVIGWCGRNSVKIGGTESWAARAKANWKRGAELRWARKCSQQPFPTR